MNAASFQKNLSTEFPGYLGIEFIEVTPERVVGALHVRPELCNGAGILHGGALMSLADTLGAVATLVNLPEGARTTTLESKTNFLGAVPVGARVIGECAPFHRGKTTMVWQTLVKSESGKLCAVVTQTQLVLPG
ncbi:MAG: PaaI family thioesterase [Sulfurifustaceae bacterium]